MLYRDCCIAEYWDRVTLLLPCCVEMDLFCVFSEVVQYCIMQSLNINNNNDLTLQIFHGLYVCNFPLPSPPSCKHAWMLFGTVRNHYCPHGLTLVDPY